ncbi:MAG: sulfite exporter TauE/SafE family protein [Acetobacteraceae bacterium]|nr:sulfite exporter TauE/SafE family protein [Acetobacteraceae bacterium]
MTPPFGIDLRYTLSGLLVGLLVGQTGVGGGSLMTPLLVLMFGVPPAMAVGTDLLYASATKCVGTVVHGLGNTLNWQIVRRLASGSLPGTVLGLAILAQLNVSASEQHWTSLLLGIMLILTAISLLFRSQVLVWLGPWMEGMSTGRQRGLTVLTGLLLGLFVTMTSVGAGALGMTALLLLYPRERLSVLVGTDIAHAVPLTLLAGMGHLWLGSVDTTLLAGLLAGSIPGIIIGSWLVTRLPESMLRRILAAVLIVVGLRIVF